jgi:hypothetical protein
MNRGLRNLDTFASSTDGSVPPIGPSIRAAAVSISFVLNHNVNSFKQLGLLHHSINYFAII